MRGYSRVIDSHRGAFKASNDLDNGISILADEPAPENGNASHHYKIFWASDDEGEPIGVNIDFQEGPMKENGPNGITMESLLAVVMDRLEGFQAGAFACSDNEEALAFLKAALDRLHKRTAARIGRGVEGVNVA